MYLYLKFPECPHLIERKEKPLPINKLFPALTSSFRLTQPAYPSLDTQDEVEQGPPRLYEVLAPAMKGIMETKSIVVCRPPLIHSGLEGDWSSK